MYVIKRDKTSEKMQFDKITKRISRLCYGLNEDLVDPSDLALKVIAGIYSGVTTVELDKLAAENAAYRTTIHPDWAILAARIAVSNLHKETKATFSEAMEELHKFIEPKTKLHCPLVSDKFIAVVRENAQLLNGFIDNDRDFGYNYFGFKTLERSYLLKINKVPVERPQYMILRVALGIHLDDLDAAFETYDLMSRRFFIHASPTLFSSGTNKPQLSSCFLITMKDDSIEGIYDTLKICAQVSKTAGGIGLNIHKIRASGSYIAGTNGHSNGLVPMLRVYNNTARYVDQGGNKRPGAFAIYLEPWHADIFDFLDLKRNTGSEEKRARDLFYALWIPDLFMHRVEDNGDWSLFCPHEAPGLSEVWGEEFEALYTKYVAEGKARVTIKAQKLWFAIMDSQIESGTPYMLYKDACNRKSNHQNLGTIKCSNLCVTPETRLLTSKGDIPIGQLEGQDVKVWNGSNWSKTTVVKTNENADIISVKLSNGNVIECTPYHKFILRENRREIAASELKPGDVLASYTMIPGPIPVVNPEKIEEPYSHGFYAAIGYRNKGDSYVLVKHDNELVMERLAISRTELANRIYSRCFLKDTVSREQCVPPNMSFDDKLEWLAGAYDSAGCYEITSEGLKIFFPVEISCAKDVRSLLLTLGVSSKLKRVGIETGKEYAIHGRSGLVLDNFSNDVIEIDEQGTFRLVSYGFRPVTLSNIIDGGFAKISAEKKPDWAYKTESPVVLEVSGVIKKSDTFCVNEPEYHTVIFNGDITGNCTEIVEYSDPDEVAVCNLASLALPMFVKKDKTFDFEELFRVTQVATRNLNKIIDINLYVVEEAKKSNLRHRPIGLGVQGLADVFIMMRLPYESEEAAKLNREIFETIYFASLTASNQIAIVEGPYETYKGSPVSKGILQFDMWDDVAPHSGRWDWELLKENIKKHGVRNSLLVAPMPTATTAQILGNNESFEPYTSNLYSRRVLAGEFQVANHHLLDDLIKLGLWDENMRQTLIAHNGSVQNIPQIPADLKAIYKTVWEIPQKTFLDMCKDRGVYIDQSQSTNIHMTAPNTGKLTSMHFYGWKKGLKTGMYYFRTRPAVDAIKFTVDQRLMSSGGTTPIKKEVSIDSANAELIACSLADPEGCLMCSS